MFDVAAPTYCAVHPERTAEGPCARCGTFSCSECLRTVDGKRICASCESRVRTLPWDKRAEIGMLKAWWQTALKFISAPVETLEGVEPIDSGIGESIIFSVIATVCGYLTTVGVYALIVVFAMVGIGGKNDLGFPAVAGIGVGGVLGMFVLLVGSGVVMMLGLSGIEVLILRMFGAPQANYSMQVRAHAFAMSPYMLGLVPFCGAYIFPIWAVVVRVMTTRALQKVPTGLAIGAVLGPVGVCCVGVGGCYMFAIVAAAMGQK